jgi:solute carrier family 25 (mitochondrial citrate transporter), member 1
VAVITPMEVIKIRLQAQQHSMSDPTDVPKCRNAGHALFTVVREEGFGALYRGVSLTALSQGTNQAANFTVYTYFKEQLYNYQPDYVGGTLPGYQTTLMGLYLVRWARLAMRRLIQSRCGCRRRRRRRG